MKRFVSVMFIALLVFSAAFAARKAEIPANQNFRVERVIKEAVDAVYQQHILSKTGTKSATAAYEPEFNAILIDSSKNGFGMVSGVTNPVSHSGETFVMAYRQWIGINSSSGAIGMSYSLDNGETWTTQSQLNASAPGELVGRYPSAIGAGDYPFIAWNEYVGANSGVENASKPLYVMDMLGWGGGYLNIPAVIGVPSSNPEGLWMGCPDYSEEPDGTGHINMTYTTWREFDANDISSLNMYLFRSTDISEGSVSFSAAEKILDVLEYFEPGSASGSTTSDALISINNNGVGYVANVAYWHPDYASQVDNNDYHTFKFRKTTDYGQTWSASSFDTDVPYYYVPDNVFDDNIFDVYLPSQQFEVVIDGETLIVDALTGSESAVLDTLNYPGLFIGYDNDMIVDQNGGVHFMCLVIPESEESGYITPTVHEGCGFYHLYCADPASESAEWEVSFVTSMQNTWRFSYGNSDRAWQSFFPAMATSTENSDVLYVVYPKANTYTEYSEEEGDTLIYMKSYDIYVNRSTDAGKTWQGEINVTNTDDFDEICAHADPDATDDHVYIVYQVPDYTTHTVDADESDAVPEDYKNLVYFMDVTTSSLINHPVLSLLPASLTYDFGSVQAGSIPSPDKYSFTLKNSGAGTLTGTVSESASWLSLSDNYFSLDANEEITFTVTATTDELSVGNYSEIISVNSNGGYEEGLVEVSIYEVSIYNKPYQWHSAPICGDERGTNNPTFANAPGFSHPYGVAVSGNGRIWSSSYYGSDFYDKAIMVWDPVAAVLDIVGPEIGWNSVTDEIGLCRFMQTTGDGNIAYGDWTNDMITVFDQNTYEVVARSELGLNTGGGMNAFYYNNNQYYITQQILGNTVVIYDAGFNIICTLEGGAGGRNVYCSRDGSVIISPSLGGNYFVEWRGNIIDGYTEIDTVYLEDINVDMGNLMFVSRNGSVDDNLWLFSRDAANDGVYVVDPFNDYNILMYTNTDSSIASVNEFSLGMAVDNQYMIWLDQGIIFNSEYWTPLEYQQPWVLRAPCQVSTYVDMATSTEYLYLADFYGYTLKCWERDYIQEPESITISVKDAANTLDLSFGWADDATDGYDPDYDQYAPPDPPSGSFDARFTKDGEDYIKDYRQTISEGETIIWNLNFKASSDNGPIALEWDPSALSSEGSFTLQDSDGGSLVNINMRNVSSYTDTDTAPDQLQIVYSLSTDVEQAMMSGWNMISLPVEPGPENSNYLDLYPDAINNTLYDYNGVYNTATELQTGKGYWLRFSEAHNYLTAGAVINSKDIALAEGWNMIGALSNDITTSNISDPGGIIISGTLYGYNGTYYTADILEAGKGYWIRANNAGTINLSTSSNMQKSHPADLENFPALVFKSPSGQTQCLSFNVQLAENVNLLCYSLPPIAPQAEMDCRFAGDMKILEGEEGIFTITAKEMVNLQAQNLPEGKTYEIEDLANGEIQHLSSTLTISLSQGSYALRTAENIPATFVVEANYPNPFNPVTTISYGLPETSRVQIKIYNISGKLVRNLLDAKQSAGYHHILWNGCDNRGRSLSTGIYLYKVQAGDRFETHKMMLVK